MTRLVLGVLLVALLAAPSAFAGNNTYCVGARGECSTPAIEAKHSKWHFHTFVTDGEHCYECYDEVDNTCETNFLRNHSGWSTTGLGRCLAIGMAPQDEGVKFHVIGGREVTPPKKPKPPPKKKVTLRGEIYKRTPGPYAVGDSVTLNVRVMKGKEARTFSGGTVIVTDKTGKELERVPVRVKGGSAKTAKVSIKLPPGTVRVSFVPDDPGLRSNEVLGNVDNPQLAFVVGSCPFRGALDGTPSVLLIGDSLEVTGAVRAHKGKADASKLGGAKLELLLQLDDGLEARFPATLSGTSIRGSITAPDIDGKSATGKVSVVSTGSPTICPGTSKPVTVSRVPFTLTGTAPDQCWTGQECVATFDVGVGTGPAADKARALLASPELEVIAKVGADRVSVDGTAAGGRLTLRTTPEREGRVTFSVELLGKGESVRAEAWSDVAEAITLRLPEDLDLGKVSGGDVADSCVNLDFSGSNGAMGARFAVSLADPCADCEAELVTVADGTAYELPLDELTIGKDQVLPICLRVGRCPTGADGGEQTLVVTPLESKFAGQEKRVRVRYTVAGKGSLECWGWVLWWILGAIALFVIWYGFKRPVGFPPGASILVASDSRKLRRAAKMLLEDQPGGKKGWYRSARVHVDGGGASCKSSRDALFTLVPYGGGVGIVASGLLRQDKRTRKMEPAEPLPGDKAVSLSRGREYQVGSLVLKLG